MERVTRYLSRRSSRRTTSDASREALAFYQRRVALFGLVGAGLSSAYLVFGLVENWRSALAYIREANFQFHLAGAATAAAMWLLCRRGRRSLGFVKTVETVGFGASCLAYEAMAWSIPLIGRPDLLIVFVLSLVVFARAVYVPSSPLRTLALGLMVGLPLPLGAYLRLSSIEPAPFAVVAPALGVSSVEQLASGGSIAVAFSWLMSVLLATGTSNVIYGLRREAREARKLGQYTLEEKLGEGGMGIVYRARHAMLRRPTAVKLLPPDRAGEVSLARFEREVQLTASLTHPNTVTVFDYGRTLDGTFYYAMELLDGASLESVVAVAGRLPPERVAHIVYHVASALSEAHQVGLIHRDIKPANIMLCRAGRCRRRRQGRRLRPGEGRRARDERVAHPRRRDRGHAALSLARGDHRPRHDGRPFRPVLARGGRLLRADRHPRLRRQDGSRGLQQAPARDARASVTPDRLPASRGPGVAAARLPRQAAREATDDRR